MRFTMEFLRARRSSDLHEMRFDQGAVREIHARIDIAGFIGSYVSLRKRGNDLVGLCPFHTEKTPSFHVHPDKGFFKCFGCGAGGDVITFLSKLENLSFPDAVRMLAQKAGVELEPESPQTMRMRSEREAIYEANHIATAFFERMLRDPSAGEARNYCERRGISQASIEKFHLGYAPDSWSALADELQRGGVDLDDCRKGVLGQARGARLSRFLSRQIDGADVCDDRRSDCVRRTRAGRCGAEILEHLDHAGLYERAAPLRTQRRAARCSKRSHADRRRRLSRLHCAPSSGIRERRRFPRHVLYRRPSQRAAKICRRNLSYVSMATRQGTLRPAKPLR